MTTECKQHPMDAAPPSWLAAAVRGIVAWAIDFCLTGVKFYGWVFRIFTGIGLRPDD